MKSRIKRMNAYVEPRGYNTVIYSYATPIMIKVNGIWYESPKKYSVTTSKQKSIIKQEQGITATTVDHNDFIKLCLKVGVTNLGRA